MADDRGGLRVVFDRDDSFRDTITSYEIQSSYMTSTDGFEFELYDTDRAKLRGLELQPITLVINDRPIVVGRIEKTRRGGSSGTALRCLGRDYIAELVEGNVDPSLKIKDGMTVIDAVAAAVAACGITTVIGESDLALRNIRTGRNINTHKIDQAFRSRKLKDYKPKFSEGTSEGIYEFVARILARHGVTLQPANARNTVVIAAPQYKQDSAYRLRRRLDAEDAIANNVEDSEADRDFTHFPTYTMFSGANLTDDNGNSIRPDIKIDMSDLVEGFNGELRDILRETVIPGRILPSNGAAFGLGQLYRLHYTKDKDSKTKSQLEFVAKRQLAEHLKDTLHYTATVKGHTDPESGCTWAVDTMVDVDDDVCDVHEPLWIESVTYTYDSGKGSQTHLECWRPDSFQIGE